MAEASQQNINHTQHNNLQAQGQA